MKKKLRFVPEKIQTPISSLIDVVFLLLIFFVCTLKIVAPEGNFNVNLPSLGPGMIEAAEKEVPAEIKVRLIATEEGELAEIKLGSRSLGNGPAAFQKLNADVLKIIGRPGSPAAEQTEATIDADYQLHYRYIIKTISSVSGRRDPATGQTVRYVERIKFAPPRTAQK